MYAPPSGYSSRLKSYVAVELLHVKRIIVLPFLPAYTLLSVMGSLNPKNLLSLWYLRFLSALNEYFAICASKTLQKSSAIQKKSVNLSSEIIAESYSFAVFIHYKVFRKLKGIPKIPLIAKFSTSYFHRTHVNYETMKFIDIPEESQRQAINTVALNSGLPPSSIEKDWWVTQVLKALHSLPYSEHIAFKGGTSLSKCWNLIERFSEDIDIAISREYLGFSGELSKTQISDKLRRAACTFVREKMQFDVKEALINQCIRGMSTELCHAAVPGTVGV